MDLPPAHKHEANRVSKQNDEARVARVFQYGDGLGIHGLESHTGAVVVGEVATLAHEVLDDAVEGAAPVAMGIGSASVTAPSLHARGWHKNECPHAKKKGVINLVLEAEALLASAESAEVLGRLRNDVGAELL
jgi:hypothetical protein